MNGDVWYGIVGFLLLSLFAILIAVGLSSWVERGLLKRNKKKAFLIIDKLLEDIQKSNETDKQGLIDDALTLIYKKLFKVDSITLLSFIEDYLLIRLKEHGGDLERYSSAKSILDPIVDEERKKLPYNGIGGIEQGTMYSIEDILKDKPELERVRVKLAELADSIRNDRMNLEKAKRLNTWTIPLAIISFLLTLIAFFGGTKISKKDFDTFDEHVSTVMSRTLDSLSMDQSDKALDLTPEKANNQ